MLNREHGSLNTAAQVQLAENALDMNLDRRFGQIQGTGDFLIGNTLRKPGERLALTRRQRVDVRHRGGGARVVAADLHHELRSHFRRQDGVAFNRVTDTGKEEVRVDLLQQIAAGTEAHAFDEVIAVFAHRQHQNRHMGLGFQDLSEGLVTVHHRHIQVKQHHIRLKLLGELDTVKAVIGFANDLEVGLTLQKRLQTAAEKRVVIDKKDSDFLAAVFRFRRIC